MKLDSADALLDGVAPSRKATGSGRAWSRNGSVAADEAEPELLAGLGMLGPEVHGGIGVSTAVAGAVGDASRACRAVSIVERLERCAAEDVGRMEMEAGDDRIRWLGLGPHGGPPVVG
jgi:hypothetical protein